MDTVGPWCVRVWLSLLGALQSQSLTVLNACICVSIQIYTYVGDILLAINPYTKLSGVYGKKQAIEYGAIKSTNGPPHIFAIAQKVRARAHNLDGGRVLLSSVEDSETHDASADGRKNTLTERSLQCAGTIICIIVKIFLSLTDLNTCIPPIMFVCFRRTKI